MNILLPSLLSGLFATVITLVVSTYQNRKQEKREYKMFVFRELFSNLSDITSTSIPTGDFQKAINQVFIAYNDNKEVLSAFESFRKNVQYENGADKSQKVIDSLLLLLKAMAKDLSLDYSFSNDDLFTKPIQVGRSVR